MICKSACIVHSFNKPMLALEVTQKDMIEWLKKYEHKLPQDIEIKVKQKHRSLDANSYMWVLADRIAAEIGVTKEEVYRQHIHDVGVFTDIAVAQAAADSFIKNFESNGVGWIAEKQADCKLKGCDKIRCYYGSSTYDSKQMSRLIDSLVEEAKTLMIETLTPDELERIKQAWNTR